MCNQKAQGWQEARKFLQQRGRTRNTQQERDKAMLYQKKKNKKETRRPTRKATRETKQSKSEGKNWTNC